MAGEPEGAALQLVSLFVQDSLHENLSMLEAFAVKPGLVRLYCSVPESAKPLHVVCAFALAALRCTPMSLRVVVSPLVIEPVFCCSENSSSSVQQAFLDVCRDHADRAMLHAISGQDSGVLLNVIAEDFHKCLLEPPSLSSYQICVGASPTAQVMSSTPVVIEPRTAASLDDADKTLQKCETPSLPALNLSGLLSNVEEHAIPEKCRHVIDDIRSIFEIKGDGLEGKKSGMREMLDRALEKISADLYSEDCHFVMELIQNADDNSYADGTEARLEFELNHGAIVSINNETGFSEKNVRGLCNVGGSTKGSGGAGYIGQKGIGFKSVFSVSDTPEIHSNGYHFALDQTHKVIPKQIEIRDLHVAAKKFPNETCIVLPLNVRMMDRIEYLASKFEDISPLLLLFLNRLRRLVVNDTCVSEVRRDMRRLDRPDGVVELRTNSEIERYFVVKRLVDVPEGVRRNVEAPQTEIALALALCDDSQTIPGTGFPVFAYLPVQSYGLKFILQGDWILASGRESIRADSTWNQWLRDEVPQLFLETVEEAKKEGSPLDIQLVLDVIPLPSDVSTFLKPAAKEIVRRLKGWECLPMENGGWTMPSKIILGEQARDFVSSKILELHLGKVLLRQVGLRV
jgi:hypothetical protein